MKICKRCKQELPPEAFQKGAQPKYKDGRRTICRLCIKAQYAGRWRPGKRRTSTKDKELARGKARDAVRHGLLIKPNTCDKCGKDTPKHLLDGHHHDYSKPLEVTWLCRSCHGLESMIFD